MTRDSPPESPRWLLPIGKRGGTDDAGRGTDRYGMGGAGVGEGTTDIAKVVSAFVDSLARHVRVERVILFGSRARGETSEDSDVDLLVISPDFGKMSWPTSRC